MISGNRELSVLGMVSSSWDMCEDVNEVYTNTKQNINAAVNLCTTKINVVDESFPVSSKLLKNS